MKKKKKLEWEHEEETEKKKSSIRSWRISRSSRTRSSKRRKSWKKRRSRTRSLGKKQEEEKEEEPLPKNPHKHVAMQVQHLMQCPNWMSWLGLFWLWMHQFHRTSWEKLFQYACSRRHAIHQVFFSIFEPQSPLPLSLYETRIMLFFSGEGPYRCLPHMVPFQNMYQTTPR